MNSDKPYQDHYRRLLELTAPPVSLARFIEENRVLREANERGNRISVRPSTEAVKSVSRVSQGNPDVAKFPRQQF